MENAVNDNLLLSDLTIDHSDFNPLDEDLVIEHEVFNPLGEDLKIIPDPLSEDLVIVKSSLDEDLVPQFAEEEKITLNIQELTEKLANKVNRIIFIRAISETITEVSPGDANNVYERLEEAVKAKLAGKIDYYAETRVINLFKDLKNKSVEYGKLMEILKPTGVTEELLQSFHEDTLMTDADKNTLDLYISQNKTGDVLKMYEGFISDLKKTEVDGKYDLKQLSPLALYLLTLASTRMVERAKTREESVEYVRTIVQEPSNALRMNLAREAFNKLPEDLQKKVLELQGKQNIEIGDQDVKEIVEKLAEEIHKKKKDGITVEEAFSLLRKEHNTVYHPFFLAVFPGLLKLEAGTDRIAVLHALVNLNLTQQTAEDLAVLEKFKDAIKFEAESVVVASPEVKIYTETEIEKITLEQKFEIILDAMVDLGSDIQNGEYDKSGAKFAKLYVFAMNLASQIASDKAHGDLKSEDYLGLLMGIKKEIEDVTPQILRGGTDSFNPKIYSRFAGDRVLTEAEIDKASPEKEQEVLNRLINEELVDSSFQEYISRIKEKTKNEEESVEPETLLQEQSLPSDKRVKNTKKWQKLLLTGTAGLIVLSMLLAGRGQQVEAVKTIPGQPPAGQTVPVSGATTQGDVVGGVVFNSPREQAGYPNPNESALPSQNPVTPENQPVQPPAPQTNQEGETTPSTDVNKKVIMKITIGNKEGENVFPTWGHFNRYLAKTLGVDMPVGYQWGDQFGEVYDAESVAVTGKKSNIPGRQEAELEKTHWNDSFEITQDIVDIMKANLQKAGFLK